MNKRLRIKFKENIFKKIMKQYLKKIFDDIIK